jgi:hypothetical protein
MGLLSFFVELSPIVDFMAYIWRSSIHIAAFEEPFSLGVVVFHWEL